MGEVIRFISKSEQERISLILAFQTFSLHWSLLTAIFSPSAEKAAELMPVNCPSSLRIGRQLLGSQRLRPALLEPNPTPEKCTPSPSE